MKDKTKLTAVPELPKSDPHEEIVLDAIRRNPHRPRVHYAAHQH